MTEAVRTQAVAALRRAALSIADGATSPASLHVSTHELDDAPPPHHGGVSDPYVWVDTWLHQAHLAIRWRAHQGDIYALDCAGRGDTDYGDVHLDEIDGVDQAVREAVASAVRTHLDNQDPNTPNLTVMTGSKVRT